MAETAIRVQDVGKRYRVGALRKRQDRLTERLSEALTQPVRRAGRLLRGDASGATDLDDTFWALRHVTFEVARGEVVGLIGQNGAGKSTLLKILSRITGLTEGRAEIHGRVGSLLEVGTGFHRDLTGRENIYLNGAILGMRKTEVDSKLDEIIAFSGVEKFIETPVKRFSSGMYLRLAFAVAAHLEPEIMLVDEVLAVGDAEFQAKCLGKMGEVAREGRTVLFVSHNLGAVQALCTRALLLRQGGGIAADGPASATVSEYLRNLEHAAAHSLLDRKDRRGRGDVRLASIEMSAGESVASHVLVTGRAASFVFHATGLCDRATCSFTIYDQFGQPITSFASAERGSEDRVSAHGGATFRCDVDQLMLRPGRYRISASLACDGELQDHLEAAAFIEVEEGETLGRPIARAGRSGNVFMTHRWILPAGPRAT